MAVDGIEVEIAETKRFQLDCVLYECSDVFRGDAFRTLRFDPAVGRPYVEKGVLWIWTFRKFDIIYAVSEDFSKVVLLELRPEAKRQGKMLTMVWTTISRVNAIKSLFGL